MKISYLQREITDLQWKNRYLQREIRYMSPQNPGNYKKGAKLLSRWKYLDFLLAYPRRGLVLLPFHRPLKHLTYPHLLVKKRAP